MGTVKVEGGKVVPSGLKQPSLFSDQSGETEEEKVANEELDASTEEEVMTTPWKSTSNPWVRDIFRLNHRDGFRPRFVSPENVSRKQEEGWQVADCNDYGIDQGNEGTVVTRRGTVLMEMPESLALEREKYFREMSEMSSYKNDDDKLSSDVDGIEAIAHDSVDLQRTHIKTKGRRLVGRKNIRR